jgi:hypothetical protein
MARRAEMTVRFSPDERAALDALAKRLGVSVAAAIRLLVRGVALGDYDVRWLFSAREVRKVKD